MAHPERLSDLEQRDHCGVAFSLLKTAQVLLAEAGLGGEVFLSHPGPLAQLRYVLTNEKSHIHLRRSAQWHEQVYQL